jgi:lipopolysaccharide export system permease protein
MKTIRRLIYGEVISSIAMVALGFLSLFYFFDLVDELQYIGKKNSLAGLGDVYQIKHALLYVTLLVPNHLYELLPISVLIGTIFVMARLAQSSEFTILRTSGLGPWRALQLLLGIGVFFVVLSFAVGDYLAPLSDRTAQLLKGRYQNSITVGQTGAWLREKKAYNSYVANIKILTPNSEMREVQILEFNNDGFMVSITQAPKAVFSNGNAWLLAQATRTELAIPQAGAGEVSTSKEPPKVSNIQIESYRWPTDLTEEMVSVALLKPDRMATLDLLNYIRHLDANGQTAQRYEIEFWKKVFYPLSCLVMVILALPFAYLHFRSGGIAGYVFAGVMIGISFFLLNNVFGYIGNLRNWQPWIAAAAPGLLYMAASLGAFSILVLKR